MWQMYIVYSMFIVWETIKSSALSWYGGAPRGGPLTDRLQFVYFFPAIDAPPHLLQTISVDVLKLVLLAEKTQSTLHVV